MKPLITALAIALLGLTAAACSNNAPVASIAQETPSLSDVSGFSTGTSAPVATKAVVFFDPRCNHCGALYEAASTIKDHRFEWIPVSVLGMASEGLSAIILASEAPAAAFEAIKSGNAPRFDVAAEAKRKQVLINTRHMQSRGANAVPYILIVRDGQVLQEVQGAVPAGQLRAMLEADAR